MDRFNLKIGDPALCFLKLRGACGHYRLSRNGFGLNHEIAIDINHLNRGLQSPEGWIEVLRTLAHECIHHWEHVQCGRNKGGRYHTVVFRKKAEQMGLLVDERGYSLGIIPDSPFVALLEEYGVSVPQLAPILNTPAKTAPTKLKLWECKCALPFKLRIARSNPRVRCEYCGRLFEERGA
ncbi:SprT family zinc-dependent metalloprotease [Rhodopirellula islandica]|uniref:SprT family zinc-dependent metalloprotease n=1 Tax=Rhodopirellula islandica TaxID=595434 RepID=UPI001364B730|nr:SprT family zinc-dependent metalloprotease [Rhodopirellula islandica]